MEENSTESLFGSGFQRQVLKLFATNLQYAINYGSLLKEEYFEQQTTRIVFGLIKDFVYAYEKEMDMSAMVAELDTYVQTHGLANDMAKNIRMEAKAILGSHIKSEQYIIDKMVEFCRRRELTSALIECVDIMEKNGSYERALQLVDKAVSIGAGKDDGFTMNEVYNLQQIYKEIYDPATLVPTGFPQFDHCLMGGMAPGELHVIMAPPKSGKSTFGANVGFHNLKIGKSVFHISLEIKKEDVAMKYAMLATGCTQRDLMAMPEDEYKRLINRFDKLKPNLFINYWTEGTANTLNIRSWISRIRSKTGVKPDLIIIDYDDCLNPTTGRTDSMYDNSGTVYSDMISLADYFKCPILTFAQPQREAWDAVNEGKVIQSFQLAHSARKAHRCYSVSSLNFGENSNKGILFADLVRRGESKVKIKIEKQLNKGLIYETRK